MPRVVLAYLLCALIWGTTWFAIRICIGPGGYPTLTALALRFAIAAVLLIPLAIRARAWPTDARTWSWLVAAGVLDAVGYGLVYIGEERVSGGIAAVVYGTQPLLLAILLTVVRIEHLTKRHIAGAIISLAGVVVLFLDRLDVSSEQALGVALVFGSVVIATCYNVIMKRHGQGVHPVVSTAVFIIVTAIVVGVVAVATGASMPWPPPLKPSIALSYLAIMGTVVAFLCYFWLLRATSLRVTSTQVFVFPLVALLTDALFERAIALGPYAYLGAGITLAGLAVSLRRAGGASTMGPDVDDRA